MFEDSRAKAQFILNGPQPTNEAANLIGTIILFVVFAYHLSGHKPEKMGLNPRTVKKRHETSYMGSCLQCLFSNTFSLSSATNLSLWSLTVSIFRFDFAMLLIREWQVQWIELNHEWKQGFSRWRWCQYRR